MEIDTRLKTKNMHLHAPLLQQLPLIGKTFTKYYYMIIMSLISPKLISIVSEQRKHWISRGLHLSECVRVGAILKPTCHIRWSCSSGLSRADLLLLAHWLHTLPQTLAKHLGKFIHTTPSAWSSHPCLLASSRDSLCLSILHLFNFIYY